MNQSSTAPPQLLTVAEAAAALGVKKDYIYQAIREGDLSAVYLGRGARPVMRVQPSDLHEFIQSRRFAGNWEPAGA